LKKVAHGTLEDHALFVVLYTIPCILHAENSMGIKLLTMLLIEGLDNCKKGLLYPQINALGKKVEQYLLDVQTMINKSILGTKTDPSQWQCKHVDERTKAVAPIIMDNVRMRQIVNALDKLIEIAAKSSEQETLWNETLNNYQTAMILLHKKRTL
jgi:hypothetical protein